VAIPAQPSPVRVLYIAGSGRSGTTFLGHLLGQAEGVCYVGEVMQARASLDTQRCGCGVPLRECDFWTAVRRHAGGARLLEASEFFGLGALARWRHLPLTFVYGRRRRLESLYGEHWRGCERLYRAITEATGCEVVVDSSKAVPYLRMLSLLPELEVHVVHVVRDARAVAYSWQRVKPTPDRFNAVSMKRLARGAAAITWSISNAGAELFGRRVPGAYLRLRYEDIIAEPRASIERILRLVTERRAVLPFVSERVVDLRSTHSVKGNPDRLATGRTELKLDDEWKSRMSRSDHRFVTAMTWPLLVRYGYEARISGDTRT